MPRRPPFDPTSPAPPRALAIVGALAAALALAGPAGLCAGTEAPAAPAHPFTLTEDAGGHADLSRLVVFGFSEDGPGENDPQVYNDLQPDMVLRSWQAVRGDMTIPGNYNQEFLQECRSRRILFSAGMDASSVFSFQTEGYQQFKSLSTRDAEGYAVPHNGFDPPDAQGPQQHYADLPWAHKDIEDMRKASLADPRWRARILKTVQAQIDLGADAIELTEADRRATVGTWCIASTETRATTTRFSPTSTATCSTNIRPTGRRTGRSCSTWTGTTPCTAICLWTTSPAISITGVISRRMAGPATRRTAATAARIVPPTPWPRNGGTCAIPRPCAWAGATSSTPPWAFTGNCWS